MVEMVVDGVEAFRDATAPETRRRELTDQTGAGDGNQAWLQSPSRSHTHYASSLLHPVLTLIVCLLLTLPSQMAETSHKITITISVHVVQ